MKITKCEVKCEYCGDEKAEFQCKECDGIICIDCLDGHDCFEDAVDDLRNRFFKEIITKRKEKA